MSNRDQPLTVEIDGGDRLVISIGIDALMVAVCGGDYWDDASMSVLDAGELAEDIVRELLDEQDDGTTPVHLMIDAATEAAIENGSAAVAHFDDADGDDS